jgi:hypothetical protein
MNGRYFIKFQRKSQKKFKLWLRRFLRFVEFGFLGKISKIPMRSVECPDKNDGKRKPGKYKTVRNRFLFWVTAAI